MTITDTTTPVAVDPSAAVAPVAVAPAVGTDPTVVAPAVATDPVTAKLASLGVKPDIIQKIVADEFTLEGLSSLTEADLAGYGMKKGAIRELLVALKASVPASPSPNPAEAVAVHPAINYGMPMSLNVLPTVPNFESWLSTLRTGGVLKVNEATVISAVRAALACKVGLFDITAKLVEAMERFAETSEEPVHESYFKLRKELTRRSYADVFAAIEGLDGTFVTEGRKKALLAKLNEYFWPSLISFYKQLDLWQDTWSKSSQNPAGLYGVLASLGLGGGGGMPLPPGAVMAPPDTGVIRDAADAVSDATNRVFAGMGAPIATALAYEASQITESLNSPHLHLLVGAPNREMMLRQLEAGIPASYSRMEQSLTQFVVSVLHVKDQPSGRDEINYLVQLYMLGSQIQWDQIPDHGRSVSSGGELSGIGSSSKPRSGYGDTRRRRDEL